MEMFRESVPDRNELAERMREKYDRLGSRNPFWSASTLVYQTLLEAIVDCELPGGTVIRQSDVAEEFGLSRTPVRDAILRLSSEGYLEKAPQSESLRVYQFNVKDYIKLVRYRSALECLAIRQCALDISPRYLDDLRKSLDNLKNAVGVNARQEMLDADDWFHVTLIEACRNPYVLSSYMHNIDRIRFFRNILSVKQNRESTYNAHERMYKAIEEHNQDAAESALKRHLLYSKHLAESVF